MAKHLTEADFERYLAGETSLFETIRFNRHLKLCSTCRELEDTLRNRLNFLDEFKRGITRMKEAEQKIQTICATSNSSLKK